jgi:hypothetical protein
MRQGKPQIIDKLCLIQGLLYMLQEDNGHEYSMHKHHNAHYTAHIEKKI